MEIYFIQECKNKIFFPLENDLRQFRIQSSATILFSKETRFMVRIILRFLFNVECLSMYGTYII